MRLPFFQRLIAIVLCVVLLPVDVHAAGEQSLKPGDELDLTILTTNDSLIGYTQHVVLPDDGFVTLPLVGRQPWLGKTPEQIVPDLQKAYRRIFAYAFVGLQFVRHKPADSLSTEVVYLSGQAKGGGAISPPQPGVRLSLVDLIGRAGGLSELADAEHILIYRAAGGVETVNFEKALQEGQAGRILLQPGDTVRVPGNWQAFINTYMPLVQVVSLIVGGVLFVGGFILNGQAAGRQAPANP